MKSKHIFQCRKCGKCCGNFGSPYDGFHIYELAEFLDIDIDTLIDRYYGTASVKEDGEKVWASDDNKRRPLSLLSRRQNLHGIFGST